MVIVASPSLRSIAFATLAAACLAWSAGAAAQLDYTRRAVTVRAGPDHAFPQVTRLQNGMNLRVVGCIAEPDAWCDVQAGRARGWLPRDDLAQSARVRNAPAVSFSVAEYWEAHYRSRPWFAGLDRWQGWGTPGFVPPPPRS
jgi:uncharacterized protein YraI